MVPAAGLGGGREPSALLPAPGRNADHPGQRLGTERRLRAAQHFDPFDVRREQIREIEDASGHGIHPDAVDQHQRMSPGAAANACRSDLAGAAGLGHLDARYRSQKIEDRDGIAPLDLLRVDYGDRTADFARRNLVAVCADDDLLLDERRLLRLATFHGAHLVTLCQSRGEDRPEQQKKRRQRRRIERQARAVGKQGSAAEQPPGRLAVLPSGLLPSRTFDPLRPGAPTEPLPQKAAKHLARSRPSLPAIPVPQRNQVLPGIHQN